jgi:6-phosphogluconolactonase
MPRMSVELIVLDDERAAARAAGELLAENAAAGGHIALSGGRSPEAAYRRAAELQPDWSRAEIWWGDERCVPPDDERSNYRLVKRCLLDRLREAPRDIHRIRGEMDPEYAAVEYDAALQGVRLALNLLGLGPDGHTASLFPNAPALSEEEGLAVAAEPGLEPWVPRVTMTPPALRNADLIVFLVSGEDKAEAAARAFGGPPSRATPAGLIRSDGGRTVALLDRAAAALLER